MEEKHIDNAAYSIRSGVPCKKTEHLWVIKEDIWDIPFFFDMAEDWHKYMGEMDMCI